MITVEYTSLGLPVSDFMCETFFQDILDTIKTDKNKYFSVSSGIAIERIRVGIAEGDINHKDVTFMFKEKKFQTDEHGRIEQWPKDFCEVFSEYLDRMLNKNLESGLRVKAL